MLAGSGLGARHVETVVQDDAVFLHRAPAEVRASARVLAALGTDRLRVTAGWSVLAPDRPPDPRDAATYPQAGFAALDRAVDEARAAGLTVQLDLAFWAPRWAVARPGPDPDRERYAPDAAAFADFAHAVARRYRGRVSTWTTWNEPNNGLFLQPQSRAPAIYRAMHDAAYAELKAVDPANQVLVGGLAPLGSGSITPPLAFLRAMADRGVLRADGFSYHPYSLEVTPGTHATDPDDAMLADLPRLEALIAELHRQGRIDREWPIDITEYGYETDPPDPSARFTPDQQAAFLGWASAIARAHPTVRTHAQFLLRDLEDPDDWQTGLLFPDGTPKPAARAWALPLHASRAGGALRLAGEVRPGTGPAVVRVERLGPGGWAGVRTSGLACAPGDAAFVTDGAGAFDVLAGWQGPGTYRLVWRRPDGTEAIGAAVPVVT